MYMLVRDEGRKKEASKVTNDKAKQHNTPKAVSSELPRVGLKPTTLYTLDRALYQLSYLTSHSAPDDMHSIHASSEQGKAVHPQQTLFKKQTLELSCTGLESICYRR